MADAQANININLDASQALAQLRALQAEISTFQQKMLKLNASTAASAANVQRNLLNTINATGKFSAGMTTVASSTETFTNSLEKNKFSMGEYFRYAGGASKTFGKLFTNEFNTIEKVARERVKTLQTQYIKLGREANGAMKAISVRPLALDMDNLATKTMIAAQKQQILNQLLRQGSTNLLNWGKNTQWAGRQLMVGFTIPLTIFGSLAAKTFMELEEQAIRFKRVYGELFTTQEETDKMLDQLKLLGSEFTKYGVALKDTMAMAADAAAMGKTGADLLAQVAQASRLAVLGGVEQQQALETTISLTNAFGVATEDLTKKIDFLNAVENQTVVSIEDLTIAIPKAGPVVKQLGGDVEDLAFFLTAMKEGGINASEGANALKSGLASLINPSAKASEFLSGLGINIKSIVEGNAGDIKGTVVQFAQALDTLDPLNRARAIEQLFGKFQFSRLSTLFQNVVAEGTQASRVLKLTAASTEELAILSERELKRIESSPLFKFRKAFEDLQGAMAPVGEQFLKAITPIIEFGTKLLEKFNSMSDGGKQFVTILVAGLGVVAPTLLMIIGLVGNGVANIAKFMLFLKGIGKGGAGVQQLGMQTEYMTQQQLEANAAASALSQTHARLQQTFTSETAAVKALAAAYREAAIASRAIMSVPTARGRGAGGARAASKPAGYADGIVSVPGPKGAGDVVPAMLSPGEAVIPAKQAQKYSGFIQSMIADNVPGFFRGIFLGMPKSGARVARERTESDVIASRFVKDPNVPVTKYGHQLSPTTGHSFPISGVGGAYAKADGSKVFVKPFVDKESAVAEMRAAEIARSAHGLLAPKHTLVRIPDPTDLTGKKTFYALESKLDPLFANPTGRFTKGEMVKQLLASLLRADKDLSPGNMFGRVLTDPGPGGVYAKASGYRSMAKPGELPSLAQQAEINLLGVKGGARKFFAQSTSDIARGMTPQEYQKLMVKEIDDVLPRLRKTIDSFGLNKAERAIYDDMIKRLEAGRNVDWTKFHKMHSDVPALPPRPMELASGIVSVPGPKGAGDVVPAMLSPGEAVIPAKMAKKYGPLVNEMISGKVPGYSLGLFAPMVRKLAEQRAAAMKLPKGASSKANEAVVAFGAHQPFTRAHESIADQGMALAASQGSRFMQYTTEAFGKSKRHVLPLSTKLKLIRESLGFPATAVSNPFALMESLKSKGISKVTIMLGSDRMATKVFDEAAKASGIKLIKKEIPRGPDGVSGTETRLAVASEDRTKFGQLIATRASESTKNQVFKEIAKNMKGYKDGIVSVPGPKGAGDVVPAMLSPGEAVIPAKQSKKYAGFINSMIADNVPGFKSGLLDKWYSAPSAVSSQTRTMSWDSLDKEIKAVEKEMKSLGASAAQIKNATQKVAAHIAPDTRNVKVAGTNRKQKLWNANNLIPDLQMANQFSATMGQSKNILNDFNKTDIANTAKKLNTSQKAVTATLDKFKNGIAPSTRKEASIFREVAAATEARARGAIAGGGLPKQELAKQQRLLLQSASTRALMDTRLAGNYYETTNNRAYDPSKDAASKKQQDQKIAKANAAAITAENNNTTAKRKETQATEQSTRAKTNQAKATQQQILAEKRSEAARRGAETRARNRAEAAARAPVPAQAQRAGARGGMGMGGVGMLAMTAGMMAPMLPGKAGEVGGQLAMPLMALGMLSMLPPKIALVVAGLAVLAGGVYAIVSAFERGAKEAREFTEAMGAGSKNIQKFAEFSGKVSAGDVMQRKAEQSLTPFAIQPGESTFGQSFVGSEAGALMVKDIQESLKKVGSEETTKKIIRQMSAAVASGALSSMEAKSILSALAVEIGDYSFGINAQAQIGQIFGPNGENLETDSLSVRIKLIQEGTAEIGDLESPEFLGSIEGQKERIAQAYNDEGWWGGIKKSFAERWESILLGPIIGFFVDQQQEQGIVLGEAVATIATGLQVSREMLAAEELKYEKLIDIARAQGQIAEVERLQKQQADARLALIKEENLLVQEAVSYYNELSDFGIPGSTEKDNFLRELRTTTKQQFAGTGQEQTVTSAVSDIDKMDLAPEQEIRLLLNVRAGNVDPGSLSKILKLLEGDTEAITGYVNLESRVDGQTLGVLTTLAGMFETKEQTTTFVTKLAGATDQELYDYADAFSFLQKIQASGAVGSENVLSFFLENEEDALRFQEISEQILATPDVTKENSLQFGVAGVDEAIGASKLFAALPESQQKTYTMIATAIMQMQGDPAMMAAYRNWLGNEGNEGKSFGEFAGFSTDQITPAMSDISSVISDGDVDSSGGAEPQIDSLLKKLRDLRLATIDMKKGWEGMQQVLESVFAGGSKGIDVFEGLSNQIRRMGVGENLIEMIVGMDPDEYNKRKNELFVFDKAGNIVGTTAKLKNMQSAFNAIAIGEYINSQQSFIENTKNQISAISILTANGMSLSEAYKLVQDEALAAAIAMGATKAEIQEILRITGLAQQQRENMEAEQEKSRISESVRKTNEEFRNQVAILSQLSKAQGKYSDAQIQAIMGDSDLQKLFLTPSIDPRALQEALNNANKQADLELKIKKLTVGGQEEIFQTGLSAAMSAFSAKEEEINIQFKATIADDESLIKSAENQLAKIDFELDDYQAALQEISWAEQKINDSYKDRFDALAKVSELNDQITASKARQLDLADALSRGDIAAAAKAAQEMRSQEQSNAIETQRTMMETAQQTEIARLRSSGGLSREQIDEKILQLEKERFGIEENTIEPAQERIRLEQIQRDLRVADLEVLGKTRDEWEAIGNRVDVAQANGWKFADAMQEALNIVETLVASLLNRPIEVEAPIPSGGGGGGGNNQGSSAPAPPPPGGRTQTAGQAALSSLGVNAALAGTSGSAYVKPTPSYGFDRPVLPNALYQPSRPAMPSGGRQYAPAIPGIRIPMAKPTAIRTLTSPIKRALGGLISKYATGGKVKGYPMGGLIPYKAEGGFFKSLGSDTVPAMLTPGEFVVRRPAVKGFGKDNLEKINRGTYEGNSVYNYNLEVNVKSGSNPNEIANTVMRSIKQVEGRRIRGNNL
jgi:TP901 family phage tail tape measure protein